MTLLARSMHDIRYDADHDEILVTNPFSQAVLVFRGSADGEEAPLRVIQGPRSQIPDYVDRLDVDPVHDEIFLPAGDHILVFPRTGNGDVAPLRVIRGPKTELLGARTLTIDPVHDLIIAAGPTEVGWGELGEGEGNAYISIFNRIDKGDVKPIRMIRGPRTGLAGRVRINQIQVYPEKGWIVVTQPGPYDSIEPKDVFIGVWHINNDGDVPPRWKISGSKTGMMKPRGVALDPTHKELLVADMRRNSIFVYFFPEMF
ncbi:MAG: hypothetical protein HYX73_00900 [Acidobacteria bacterium]|nr:hypothetical protein [Acidobacteriota bacterium]